MDEFLNKLRNDKNWIAFMQFIEAPDDYFSLASTLHNFITIDSIRSRIDIEELDFMHEEFDAQIEIARQIKHDIDELSLDGTDHASMMPQGLRRRDNLIGDHPLYSMLTGPGKEVSDLHGEVWCQFAFVIIAAVKGYQRKVEEDKIKHASGNTDIGMRGVRELEKHNGDLESVLPLPQPHSNLMSLIHACEDHLQQSDNQWLKKINIMLTTFAENKEGYSRRYRCKVERTKKIEKVNLADDDDASSVTKINSTLNEKSKKMVNSLGLTADEFPTLEGLHDKDSSAHTNAAVGRIAYKKMSAKRNAIINLSQCLFYRHNTPTPREAFYAIESLKPGPLLDELKKLYGLEALSFFSLLIFTGRSVESVSTLRFPKSKSAPKKTNPELSWLSSQKLLVIPTKISDVYNKLEEDAKSLISYACGAPILGRRECYEISPPSIFQSILSEYYAYWKINYASKLMKSNDARTMAYPDPKNLIPRVVEIFDYLNERFEIRLSFRKIQRLFEQSFFKITDDQAEYAYITGERINHGLASAHYLYITPNKLHETHTFVINQILSYASQMLSIQSIQSILNLGENNNNHAVGTKLVLNAELIQLYVKSMKQLISEAGRNGSIVEIHNYYVFYCVKLLAYSTGYRAIGDPFDHISQLNKEFGLMVISDKDFDDHFHTRVVPVADLVIDQLAAYENHLQQLKRQLGHYPKLLKNIRQLLSKDTESKVPYFFFLSEKMRVISISPKHIKELIKLPWNMPENINRHYLRSEIVAISNNNSELSVSSECLDYFMGHWGTGEEPFNQHAMVSPLLIKAEIQPIIDRILKRDGWTVVKAPLV